MTVQENRPVLYAAVNPEAAKKVPIEVLVKGTGHPISEQEWRDYKYLGLANLSGGALIFHIFWRFAS